MSSPVFVPLHQHSHYTFLEGASHIKHLVEFAKAQGWPACALTDNGVLYGGIEFYSSCKAAGIAPILGCELYVIEGDITDKQIRPSLLRLVVLVQNLTGYRNLMQLISTSHLEGFYYKPRVNWELLAQHSEGLIALTSGINGVLGHPLLRGNTAQAVAHAQQLNAMFPGRLYVELADHGSPDAPNDVEKSYNLQVLTLSQQLDLPVVVTHDVRYSRPEDGAAQDILLCMQSSKTQGDASRSNVFAQGWHLRSASEIASVLSSYLPAEVVSQGFENTQYIAAQCQLELPLGQTLLPEYPLEPGETAASTLRTLVTRCAGNIYGNPLPQAVTDRLDIELGVIEQMGFPAYFLIVWDFIDFANRQGIAVGPGRGSAAGSLVAYVLGITQIDPLQHNLLFERFLNPERISMPDIDIDFCIERRGEVIEYVTQRYGQERVCQIGTFGTLAARAALKAVARVLEVPYADSDRLAKLIPAVPGTKLADALADGQPLGKLYASGDAKVPQLKELVDIACRLEGTAFNTGTHAAGVVISKDPLTHWVPLQYSKDGQVISQYPMGDLEKLGLLKMDFLGLRNLTIIHRTQQLLEQSLNLTLDLNHVALDDATVYAQLASGETDGVFQLESGGMKALVRDLRPSQFEDINALVALYRPGPLNSGMVKTFVDRKHGRAPVTYAHPALEPILKDTYGTIVYQEQIMQIAQALAGYSLGQADLLRRAMGKKKAEVMEKEREGFLAGCASNQVDPTVANTLFDAMTEFAAYCFNRSHSAAYAFVAYQTAYLKAHYPVEYLCAMLSAVRSDRDKVQQYLLLARTLNIAVLPPDVNDSMSDFSPSQAKIRFGLAGIKHVGEGVVDSLLKEREAGGRFSSLTDWVSRMPSKVLNKKTLEALIACGALDSFGHTRKQLFDNIEVMAQYATQAEQQRMSGQIGLFGAMDLVLSGHADLEWDDASKQAQERALLGFYVSSHPLDGLQEQLPTMVSHTLYSLRDVPDDTSVIVGGLIAQSEEKRTKTGKPLIIVQCEDFSGRIEAVAFREVVEQSHALLQEGQKVLFEATVQRRGGNRDDDNADSVSLIIQKIWPMDVAAPLHLRWQTIPEYTHVAYLARVLAENKGTTPVLLEYPDNACLKVDPKFWINPQQRQVVLAALSDAFPTELHVVSG